MPLRFVWGVQAVDEGRYLDPADKGRLQLDSTFNIASTRAQKWMLGFCEEIVKQPFYLQPFASIGMGPLTLSNCFMQTFKGWMERRCYDDLGTNIIIFNNYIFMHSGLGCTGLI